MYKLEESNDGQKSQESARNKDDIGPRGHLEREHCRLSGPSLFDFVVFVRFDAIARTSDGEIVFCLASMDASTGMNGMFGP
jgi:hypothetical protein